MTSISTPWRLGILIGCAAGALLLLAALVGRLPSGHYTVLRWVVCGVALCLTLVAYEEGSAAWAILLSLTAFLFNPLWPIRMRRADWRLLNVGAILLFAAGAIRFGRAKVR